MLKSRKRVGTCAKVHKPATFTFHTQSAVQFHFITPLFHKALKKECTKKSIQEAYQVFKYLFAMSVVPERGGGNGGSCPSAILPGGAMGAGLPFAFQYDSNEANVC